MTNPLDLTHARKDFELALRQDERRQCLARIEAELKRLHWSEYNDFVCALAAVKRATLKEPGA